MAACGLQHIFEKPLPENPTLIESLSWNHLKSMNSIEQTSSFTEIFGELHFKETSHLSSPSSSSSSSSLPSSSSASSSSSLTDLNQEKETKKSPPSPGSFHSYKSSCSSFSSSSSRNSDSLQLCTEGLGFESCYDLEEFKVEVKEEKEEVVKHSPSDSKSSCRENKRLRMRSESFPPPISCIGRSGKLGVCFKSFRQDGRFVLKEVRIPTQEFLHACREDGRLKLHFIQPQDIQEDEEDDEFHTAYEEDDEETETKVISDSEK